MAELHRIVSVLPDGTLNHDVMRNAILLLGAAIEARGLEHVILDGTVGTFPREILRHTLDPHTGIYLGHRFYDMGLAYDEAAGAIRRNLFAVLDRPVFAMLQDHPFSRFMWPRLQQASPTTHFVAPTPEFAAEAQFVNPTLQHFHCVSAMVTEASPAQSDIRPLAERPVDIFMSCGFNTTQPSIEELRRHYAGAGSPMTWVIDEVYETGLAAHDASMLALFRDSYQRHFGAPLKLTHPLTEADFAVLLVLSCLDLRIRLERRLKAVAGLARLDPALRIVVTLHPQARGKVHALQAGPNMELVGSIAAARARQLFLESRFAINVTPTYTRCVTERVGNAMLLGCCVISDRNSFLAETFPEGEEMLFMRDYDLGPLARYFRDDLDAAQAIATRARKHALDAFAPARLADDLIAVMRGAL